MSKPLFALASALLLLFGQLHFTEFTLPEKCYLTGFTLINYGDKLIAGIGCSRQSKQFNR